MIATEPNNFQRSLERDIRDILNNQGYGIEGRTFASIPGSDRTYVELRVEGHPITVFIYLDGAELGIGRKDFRFEGAGYESPEELREAFLEKLGEVLQRYKDGRIARRWLRR